MSEDKTTINGIGLAIHDELRWINPESDNLNYDIFKGDSVWIKSIDDNCITVNGAYGILKFNKNDIFKVFTKVRKFNCHKKWTPWIETKSGFSYRTDNEHYTEVKKDGIKVKSACHPCDVFNLAKGIAVCLQKIKNKKNINGINNICKSINAKFKYEDGIKYIEKDVFENIKSNVEYNVDENYLDVTFDSDFKEFSWADYVAPGIYLKKKSGTDEIVGIHIDNFRQIERRYRC